jgi:hypothetical protein
MNSSHVRVFSSQDILCPDNEPLCTASSDGTFWVALASGVIRGYSTHTTSSNFHKLYEFKPVWPQVIAMHYLPDLKRLVTLEKRVVKRSKLVDDNDDIMFNEVNSRTQLHQQQHQQQSTTIDPSDDASVVQQQVCRVYHLLWNHKECKTKIGVHLLPVGNQVSLISACSQSNAIQICVNRVITVWIYPQQVTTATPLAGISVTPICILKLHTSWNVKCISISKQFIGYASDADVRIVKLKYVDSGVTQEQQQQETNDTFERNNELCVVYGVTQCSVDQHNFVEIRFNTNNYDLVPSSATSIYAA